jgi:branched-chain amino acid transport system ATP-binding protein
MAGSNKQTILKIEDITMRFGGMVALNKVSAELHEGEILGLIGPNGAGKTTLFNCITGGLKPTRGRIYLGKRNITGQLPNKVCHEGIGRTFQIVRPFNSLTVRENVAVSAMAKGMSVKNSLDKAQSVLEMLDLADIAEAYPGSLTLSLKKRLEVARAMATDPKILLLDEVMAGLNINEMTAFSKLIKAIYSQGVTIMIVEHIMQAVMELCNRVIVLNFGEILKVGTPEEVMNDERVITAYLGEGYHAKG